MSYIQIYPFNLDLLSRQEKKTITSKLASSFDSDRKDFVYFTYPREIDLDDYKTNLKNKYAEEMVDLGRKHLLTVMIQQAAELATNGENYEHQHFIKIWKKIGNDKKDTEYEVKNRIQEFKNRYAEQGIKTEIIKADAILKMCNLFGNSMQAPFEVPADMAYEPIVKLR